MYCNKCGNKLEPNQRFCNKCGNRIQQPRPNTNTAETTHTNPSYGTNTTPTYSRTNTAQPRTYGGTNYNGRPNTNAYGTGQHSRHMTILLISLAVVAFILIIIAGILTINTAKDDYYFGGDIATAYPNGGATGNTISNTVGGGTGTGIGTGNAGGNTTPTTITPTAVTGEVVKQPDGSTKVTGTVSQASKTKTAIIVDNTYYDVDLSTDTEARKLIVADSEGQKTGNYPTDIKEIEDDIINKYSITAVNLKEMNADLAEELEQVIDNIYREFPEAKGYLTNVSLVNLENSQYGVIALFMPVFPFAYTDKVGNTPWVIKTQIQLSARWFLNEKMLDANLASGSQSGHFPPNTTRYSPVAHEIGHYLSFIAMMKHYGLDSILRIEDSDIQGLYSLMADFSEGAFSKSMIDEAYQNYINDTGDSIAFDDWRGTISGYALAKDDYGEYIYDETIAEAFHDTYLNGDNACTASKYVVSVLKKYIKG